MQNQLIGRAFTNYLHNKDCNTSTMSKIFQYYSKNYPTMFTQK